MKQQRCIQVKYVNNLSVHYLTRFFGSVGTVVKVQKDEVSKYVTIEFAHKTSVDKALRYDGRVLDIQPIKIKKFNQHVERKKSQKVVVEQKKDLTFQPKLFVYESHYLSLHSLEQLWQLVFQQIKPHLFQKDTQKILQLLIGSLIENLLVSVKHLMKYKVNMRSSYLKNQLQELICNRISKKISKIVVNDLSKISLEWRGQHFAMAWLSVPFPNIQEGRTKIESHSSLVKCMNDIKNGLSIRLAEIIYTLNAASLCFNLKETGSEELIHLCPESCTNQFDNFSGSKDLFNDFSAFEKENTCIFVNELGLLKTFECTLRLQGCSNHLFEDTSWYSLYTSHLIKKTFENGESLFDLKRIQRTQNVKLKENTLIFEYDHFSLNGLQRQLRNFNQIDKNQELLIFYLSKQFSQLKTHKLKKIYEDQNIEIEEEISQVETKQKTTQKSQALFSQEFIAEVVQLEIKAQSSTIFNNIKVTHYLELYIQQSVNSKGLVIPSKQMAIKLAQNIIQRQKSNRLFQSSDQNFQRIIGSQLWRVYNKFNQRKTKNMIHKYSKKGK